MQYAIRLVLWRVYNFPCLSPRLLPCVTDSLAEPLTLFANLIFTSSCAPAASSCAQSYARTSAHTARRCWFTARCLLQMGSDLNCWYIPLWRPLKLVLLLLASQQLLLRSRSFPGRTSCCNILAPSTLIFLSSLKSLLRRRRCIDRRHWHHRRRRHRHRYRHHPRLRL